jgi:short-subunit dehydrogenase
MKKVVVITGASSGLGKEIAKLLVKKESYELLLTGRNEKGFAEFENNSDVHIVLGDIVKKETRDAIEKEVKKLGRVDILINNAGIIHIKPFAENTEKELNDLIEIDMKAPMLLTQALYPLMLKQLSGHIIMINSTAGKEAKMNHTMYNAVKFGLKGFTDSLRLEAKTHGIRVTSFHPGGMNTEFYDHMTGVPTEKYMDPVKIAEILIQIIETDPTLSPDEIVINRMTK